MITETPTDGQAFVERGMDCYNRGRYRQAVAWFGKAIARGENGPEARYFMAHSLLEAGRPQRAIAEFSRLNEHFPSYAPGYLGLAQALRQGGQLAKSERIVRKALRVKPRDAQARQQTASILRQAALDHEAAGRLGMAEEAWRRLARVDRGDASARLRLVGVLKRRGKIARAESLLEVIARRDLGKLDPPDRFRMLMNRMRYEEAFELGERMLDKGPTLLDVRTFWNPWDWLPGVSAEVFQTELARLRRVRMTRSARPWLHYYRGALRGGPDGQKEFLRLADFPRKRYGWMFTKAGWASLRLGQFSESVEQFKIALCHKPVDWTTYGYLAEAYLCLGRIAMSGEVMACAMRVAPDNERGQVLAWRGALDLWSGRYRGALRRLEAACALGAQHAFCWKGAALLKLGRAAEALAFLDETISRYPLDQEAYVWRGEAKRELSLYREALPDLDKMSTWTWALFNRALVKAKLKDYRGMEKDFEAIDGVVIRHIRGKLGMPAAGKLSLKEMEQVLESGLILARGFRRDEHKQAFWLR